MSRYGQELQLSRRCNGGTMLIIECEMCRETRLQGKGFSQTRGPDPRVGNHCPDVRLFISGMGVHSMRNTLFSELNFPTVLLLPAAVGSSQRQRRVAPVVLTRDRGLWSTQERKPRAAWCGVKPPCRRTDPPSPLVPSRPRGS